MNYNLLTTITAIAGITLSAYSQPTLQEHWWHGVNEYLGIKAAIVDANTQTLYVGGGFTGGSVATTFVPPVNTANGLVVDADGEGWPGFDHHSPNGNVLASIPDGQGGWFIGGSFTLVGGTGRNGLARLNPDGSLNASWDPGGVLGGDVRAMLLNDGILYIGGSFTSAGGAVRSRLAAFDAVSALVTPWGAGLGCNNTVNALALGVENIYVGGSFTTAGGQQRTRVAALDPTDGSATLWNVTVPSGAVNTLDYSNGLVFIGGTFVSVNTTSRSRLAAIDADTGQLTPWNPNSPDDVNVIKVTGDTVFVGGTFTSIAGVPRFCFAALSLNTNTNNALPWDASLEGWSLNPVANVSTLIVRANVVYLGGLFFRAGVNGAYRQGVACLNRWTAEANAWDASARLYGAGPVLTLADGGSTIYAGGGFSSMGHRYRNGLAAFDLSTGKPTDWRGGGYSVRTLGGSPDVRSILEMGDTLFFAGGFTEVDGSERNYVAAVRKSTGELVNWLLDINAPVNALAIVGNRLFLGGEFTIVNGISRAHLVAVNIATATVALSWQADVSGSSPVVNELHTHGSDLYVGGHFETISGQPRTHIAALDATSGQLLPFAPQINGTEADIQAIVTSVSGDTVYISGRFDIINGYSRENLAALDATTSLPIIDWICSNPNFGQPEIGNALLKNGPALYSSTSQVLGGQPAVGFGVTSSMTGMPYGWNPSAQLGGVASEFIRAGDLLVACGSFSTLSGMDRKSIAVWSGISALETDLATAIQQADNDAKTVTISPNPTSGQFTMRIGNNASIIIFDATGRQIQAMEVKRSVPYVIDLSGRSEGLYSIKVVQDAHITTHKLIVQR